jgi:hypothetical protein
MTLVAKKEFSNSPLGRLVNKTPLGEKLGLPQSDPINNGLLLNVLGASPQDVDPKYREQFTALQHRVEMLYTVRQEMRAVHPALAVIDTAKAAELENTPQNNAILYREMSEGFDGMRSDMSKLSETVTKDPNKALAFDVLVSETLHSIKDPQARKQANAWVNEQRQQDELLKALGGLGTLGLTAGGLLGGPLGWGANLTRALLLGGSVLGAATAAYEFPQLQIMDLAAKAGEAGGDKLTNQTPEQARMNLMLGYANLALAGLDGLAVAPTVLAKAMKVPSVVRAAGSMTKTQGRVLLNSIGRIQGEVTDAVLEKIVHAIRGADNLTTSTVFNADGTLSQSRPLGDLADRMETRTSGPNSTNRTATAARTTEIADNLSDEAAEKLLAKYPEWNNVKDYIGRPFDPSNPPPGYSHRVRNGKPELVRDSAEGPFPPLTVKDGVVMLQTGKSTRLSVYSRYKKNYLDWVEQTQGKAARTAAQKRIQDGNQLHHLVPDAVVQDNALTRELMSRSNSYTLDRGTNILDMPKVHDPKTGEIVHLGSHPKFNNYVQRLLNQKVRELTRGDAIPLDQVDVRELDKALHQVEDTLRTQLRDRTLPRNILEPLEGGGFKISDESQEAPRGSVA